MRFWGNIVETPFEDGKAYSYAPIRIGVVAAIGVVLIVLGLRLGMDRQYYNWTFVATGLALLLLGTSYIARERAVVTSQYCELRSRWGLSTQRWHYRELTGLRYIHRYRPMSRRSFRTTLQVQTLDGHWDTVANDTGLYGLYGPFERDLCRHMSDLGMPTQRVGEERERE